MATLVCATVVVISAGIVATRAIKAEGRWWATLGGFVVSGAMILAGYAMFSNAAFMWSNL